MWFVFLGGDNESLNVLSEKFSQKIKREGGIYRIKSSEFEKLNKSEDVSNCAEKILKTMLGILNLCGIPCKNLKISNVVKEDKNGVKHTSNILKTTFNVIPSKIPTKGELEELFEYAMKNEPMEKCFIVYSNILNETACYDFYKILEVIKQDLGKDFKSFLKEINVSYEEYQDFKKFVNNPDYAGIRARHAKNFDNPRKLSGPMSLEKSEVLIKKILKGYIKRKTYISLT
mgnify:CR=1 FL=1|jgi:hypothetical protein